MASPDLGHESPHLGHVRGRALKDRQRLAQAVLLLEARLHQPGSVHVEDAEGCPGLRDGYFPK